MYTRKKELNSYLFRFKWFRAPLERISREKHERIKNDLESIVNTEEPFRMNSESQKHYSLRKAITKHPDFFTKYNGEKTIVSSTEVKLGHSPLDAVILTDSNLYIFEIKSGTPSKRNIARNHLRQEAGLIYSKYKVYPISVAVFYDQNSKKVNVEERRYSHRK